MEGCVAMTKNDDGARAFCKTFYDGSHVTVLWNRKQGIHCSVPDDLWSLPHDEASEFLRRLAEGRLTPKDRQILEDVADVIGAAVGGEK